MSEWNGASQIFRPEVYQIGDLIHILPQNGSHELNREQDVKNVFHIGIPTTDQDCGSGWLRYGIHSHLGYPHQHCYFVQEDYRDRCLRVIEPWVITWLRICYGETRSKLPGKAGETTRFSATPHLCIPTGLHTSRTWWMLKNPIHTFETRNVTSTEVINGAAFYFSLFHYHQFMSARMASLAYQCAKGIETRIVHPILQDAHSLQRLAQWFGK